MLAVYKAHNDTRDLGILYSRYMDLVYGVCLKYLENSELAKDAVMQVFEELVQKINRYQVDNFRSWLYTLAKNYCLMQLRSPRNVRVMPLDPSFMHSAEEMHQEEANVKEFTLTNMEKCLETLTVDQKQGVDLFYLQGKCYKEIAGIMNKDWNKIRSLIQNGKRNLKICMDKNTSF